ncbi:MAG TPA: hypothetical protein VGH76_11540 [Actinomycetospora sp.]|uniref:hypothetical protein n=1 Tax=Actinomycetospora sp. TaxID=1872135 RepID=UPI002F42D66E
MSVTTTRPVQPPSDRHRDRRPPRALARAVVLALRRLHEAQGGDVRQRWARYRGMEDALRAALDTQSATECDAVPAVRIACAYLAAGDAEEAFAALLTANDKLR